MTGNFLVWKPSLRRTRAEPAPVGGGLVLVVATMLVILPTSHALSQQFGPNEVPKNQDATPAGEEPVWCHPDTPGFEISFNADGTFASAKTLDEDSIQFIADKTLADGTFTGTDQGCVETERFANTVRECRMSGSNYVYVDVSYLYYTCQDKKRRIFTSFKAVKDANGQPIHCAHYQYVDEARKAKEFGEDWPGANLPVGTPASAQGLVSPIYITPIDADTTDVMWIDQAGNETVAQYNSDGSSRWDWTGKPPPKPTDLNGGWQFPGGAEKISNGEDGSKTYQYADGTTVVASPPDSNAPFTTASPKTVTVTKPDKSRLVFEWQPTGKYVRNEFDSNGNRVPEEKKAEDEKPAREKAEGENKGGVGLPNFRTESANAAYCSCPAGTCGFAVVVAMDSEKWCTYGRGGRTTATLVLANAAVSRSAHHP